MKKANRWLVSDSKVHLHLQHRRPTTVPKNRSTERRDLADVVRPVDTAVLPVEDLAAVPAASLEGGTAGRGPRRVNVIVDRFGAL